MQLARARIINWHTIANEYAQIWSCKFHLFTRPHFQRTQHSCANTTSVIFGMNITISYQVGMCMAIIEFLIADNVPVASFNHPSIFLKIEIWRFPFTLEFLRCDRDSRVTICRAYVEDKLCNRLYVRPLRGTQVEARVKECFDCFGLCVHNLSPIIIDAHGGLDMGASLDRALRGD